MHRVAGNLCIDRKRRKAPVYLEDVPPLADAAQDGAAVLRRMDTARAVNRGLARLPERQKTALVLVHYQGLTNGEVAGLLETSVDAVESLLSRARRAMRQELAPIAPDLLESE